MIASPYCFNRGGGKALAVFLALFLSVTSQAQQRDVRAAAILELPDTAVVYFNALWCAPCVKGQILMERSVDSLPSSAIYFTLFERGIFSLVTLDRIIPHRKKTEVMLMDGSYYTAKGPIQINTHKRALRAFLSDLKTAGFELYFKESDFWFGTVLVKTGNRLRLIQNLDKAALVAEAVKGVR